MKNNILFLGLFIFLIACKKDDSPEVSSKIPRGTNLRINSYKVNCSGYEGQTNCYLVQFDQLLGGEDWVYFYEQIEGFNYQQGYIYNLKVRSESVPNPPIDAPIKKYHLEEVLFKEKVQ